MRNHFAEDALNGEMINLMLCYAHSLPESKHLDGSISF